MKPKSVKNNIVKSPATITILIILCGVGLVLFLIVLKQSLTPPEMPHVDATNGDPAIESQVTQIAANFTCTCGSCGNESLDHCTCNTAVKTRGTIRAWLLEGKSAADVIEAVGRTIGGVKQY